MSSQTGIPEGLDYRLERPGEEESIRSLHRVAFSRHDEAALVDELRDGGYLILSLVADRDGEILGHIAFSRVGIENGGPRCRASILAPIAVLPAHQHQGIGKTMIHESLARLEQAGENITFVVGEPGYYARFGFTAVRAAEFDSDYSGPAFMARDLNVPDARLGSGRLIIPPPFGNMD